MPFRSVNMDKKRFLSTGHSLTNKLKLSKISVKMCMCIKIFGFPGGSAVKNLPANVGNTGSIPGDPERFPGEGIDNLSLVAQTVKHLSAMQETRVQSLGWEDPLEKEMAAHSSILAWKIPWTAEPGRLWSMGSQRVWPDFTFTFTF